MKILCIIPSINKKDGAERVMSILCNEFIKLGHDVLLYTYDKPVSAYPLNKEVVHKQIYIPFRSYRIKNFLQPFLIRRILKKENVDVVLSFLTESNIKVLKAAKNSGVPVFVSERNDPAHYPASVIKNRDKYYKYANGVICQTPEILNYFQDIIKKKGCVIANPLNRIVQKKTDYSSKKLIITVGRLAEQKNQKLLIDAFCDFHDTHKDYKLIIYGAGALKSVLENQIRTLNLSDSVFLGGSVTDIFDRMLESDIFIMPSDYEGISNSTIEAMAIGLPVISTDWDGGGARFIIQDSKNGFIVPKNDKNALLERMILLAENETLREKIGNNAKNIEKIMDPQSIANEYLKFMGIKE